ncbi:hypothetical protein HDU76_013291 [Blyttiomyces sp. JEL0837]|nr:hypothetical protein HDU76_013291 [Blyttiomyces sp. JEL0837]
MEEIAVRDFARRSSRRLSKGDGKGSVDLDYVNDGESEMMNVDVENGKAGFEIALGEDEDEVDMDDEVDYEDEFDDEDDLDYED